MSKNIAIIGTSGALGRAFTRFFSKNYPESTIHAFSRKLSEDLGGNVINEVIDYHNEASISEAATRCSKMGPIDRVIIATGILHQGEDLLPEKSLRALSANNFQKLFEVNTIVPAMIAKHFLPQLNRQTQSIFAVLSARAGSIADNQMGGWYAYRASKAALNMILKNAAIEIGRRNRKAILVGLYPGTVDSFLSKPFQRNVPAEKLFTPEFSVNQMMSLMQKMSPDDSGKFFEWDGEEVAP